MNKFRALFMVVTYAKIEEMHVKITNISDTSNFQSFVQKFVIFSQDTIFWQN